MNQASSTAKTAFPLPYGLAQKRIWVAGHRGMVGRALVSRLAVEDCEVVAVDRSDLDLRRQSEVEAWFQSHTPDVVIVAAATVGGILENHSKPAEFFFDNVVIAVNVIDAAHRFGTEKLLYLGATCMYPREAGQPLREDSLLTGPLEQTSLSYALAKIGGLHMCAAYRRQYGCDFITAIPTSVYGPNDNFDLDSGHVLPALINKFVAAQENGDETVEIWGSGNPRREFLYVDDLADALVFVLKHYSSDQPINIGGGHEVSILELTNLISDATGFSGQLRLDASKPDGTPRKLADNSKLSALGWRSSTSMEAGLEETVAWFRQHRS